MEEKKMKTYALCGVLGGLLFVAGDCLIYCYKGFSNADIDPLWADVAQWRFVLSAWFGFAGCALMLPGYLSFRRMVKRTGGRVLRVMTAFMAVGVASAGYLHFSLGSLLPITYQNVLAAGGSAGLAAEAASAWSRTLTSLNVVLIGFLFFEYLVHFALTVSGKSGLPRFMCLAGPAGALLLGLLWKFLFRGTAAEGAWGAFESLGESLVFLTVFFYWKKEKVS